MLEIQRRLQSNEARKARDLLATAMTQFEALKIVRDQLEKEILNGQYKSGHRIFGSK